MEDSSKLNKNDHDQYKESCKFSVDISKQFLTFAAGGLAFVVGLAMSIGHNIFLSHYISFVSFCISISFGLIYVMSVVSHINRSNNYNVYTCQLRFFSSFQILSFAVGVIFLASIVYYSINKHGSLSSKSISILTINIGEKEIRHIIYPNTNIAISVLEDNTININATQLNKKE